uniref:Uncharacterized protein n=1 Tax=Arundo donax TaxID=35708 RepID=A0A0A9HLH8_ARUDO
MVMVSSTCRSSSITP